MEVRSVVYRCYGLYNVLSESCMVQSICLLYAFTAVDYLSWSVFDTIRPTLNTGREVSDSLSESNQTITYIWLNFFCSLKLMDSYGTVRLLFVPV